jgi:hypothetical protein
MPNIFDHIKNITTSKGEYLGDEGWNNWMVNRYLSMDQDYVEVVNIVQKKMECQKCGEIHPHQKGWFHHIAFSNWG